MIDSHCHLADKKFAADVDAVIERAKAVGIDTMITIADSLEEADECIAIAEAHENIFATVGVHPHHAKDWQGSDVARIRDLVTKSKKAKAIGEIGLDFHYDFSPRDVQQRAFQEQLALAKEIGLPVVIHCREAIHDLKEIIKQVGAKNIVMHCCTEKWDDVKDLVAEGAFLSFTGMITYANAQTIRDTVKECPLNQLMIESDSPYLSPQAQRGKRNEPAFVVEVAKAVAEIKGISLEEVAAATTQNAIKFFRL